MAGGNRLVTEGGPQSRRFKTSRGSRLTPVDEPPGDSGDRRLRAPGSAPGQRGRRGRNGDFKTRSSIGRIIADRQIDWRNSILAARGGVFQARPGLLEALAENQRGAPGWKNARESAWVRRWCDEKAIRFLELRDMRGQLIGVPPFSIEPMNIKTLGRYQANTNGFALAGVILLNEERLRTLDPCPKRVLLMQLISCAWQHQRGGTGKFDGKCREMLEAKGLVIKGDGQISIARGGKFRELLESEGIQAPETLRFPKPQRKGQSTLRTWSCACQKCRVGTKEFVAVCPECREPFRLSDFVGQRHVEPNPSALMYYI